MVSIFVRNIFGRADIEDLNCMSMRMMEEGTSKSCIVEENVGSVMDFTPFSFEDTVHFLMFKVMCIQKGIWLRLKRRFQHQCG